MVFGLTMALLLLPKLWGLIAIKGQPARVEQHGGWNNVVTSVLLETVLTTLIAPLMMVFHSRFVFTTLLLGEKVHWSAQNRGEANTDFVTALRVYWPHTLLGLGTALVVWLAAPPLLIWFSPVVAGLMLSIPLSMLLGDVRVGQKLAHKGLLLIPEETTTPPILQAQQEAVESWERAAAQFDRSRLFEAVLLDPSFHLLHHNLLRATDAHLPAKEEDLQPIVERIQRDGPAAVSAQERVTLLSDIKALRNLHIRLRSNVRSAHTALTT